MRRRKKPNFDYIEEKFGHLSRIRLETFFIHKKRNSRLLFFGITFLLIVIITILLVKFEIKDEDVVKEVKNTSQKIAEVIKPEEETVLTYDPNYLTEEIIEKEQEQFDYYDFTEEEYNQFNDITIYDIIIPNSEEQLYRRIYQYCSEGNFIEAYQLLEAYVYDDDTEKRKEKYYSMREDLNTMAGFNNDNFYVEKLMLLPYINDPELLLYSFYDLDLREQRDIVSIKDSDILPLPRSFLRVLEKVQIRPSELPNFSKQYNSITIKGKEIWRLEVAIGKHNIPEHYVYIIIDTENAGRNKVYYIEAQDNGLWVPTTYDML